MNLRVILSRFLKWSTPRSHICAFLLFASQVRSFCETLSAPTISPEKKEIIDWEGYSLWFGADDITAPFIVEKFTFHLHRQVFPLENFHPYSKQADRDEQKQGEVPPRDNAIFEDSIVIPVMKNGRIL